MKSGVLQSPNLLVNHFGEDDCPSLLARSVAIWIDRAIVERTFPSSNASRPAMVHPPGAGKKISAN